MAPVQPGAEDPAALKAIALHAEAIATVRAFAERSDALRVVLIVDRGDESPAMLDAAPGGAIELTDEGEAHEIPPAMTSAKPRGAARSTARRGRERRARCPKRVGRTRGERSRSGSGAEREIARRTARRASARARKRPPAART